ncbi:MAG TPA: hypothetical protein VGK81_13030 [Anaerolineae bacterium]
MNLRTWATQHPKLTAWIALAIGMVVVLVIAARDVGLLWNQWLFLILATIGLAGLCVWIIGWEADDDEPEAPLEQKDQDASPSKPSA